MNSVKLDGKMTQFFLRNLLYVALLEKTLQIG